MKCPHCTGSTLVMSERQGVEIDYCPDCRGIWLDRGELDKLLERAAAPGSQARAPTAPKQRDFADSDFQGYQRKPYPHRKSWLHEIFD